MLTDKQLEANRKNAAKGGVKTENGKQISKYNAMRHGVLTYALADFEKEEAEQIKSRLFEDFEPKSIVEELLIETMSIAYTRSQRAIHAEKEYLLEVLRPPVYEDKVIIPALMEHPPTGDILTTGVIQHKLVKPGYKALISDLQIDVLDQKFARYITTCERQFIRALHELQRAQAIRKGQKLSSMAIDILPPDS